MGTYGLHHDAARRVATVFEIWCCLIETDLRARGENPPKKIAPYGTFAAVSPLEYRGLKPILPFPGGRSDAVCRVVVCLHALQLWEPMVFITTRRAASRSGLHAYHLWGSMVFITTRHAASLRSSRYGVSLIETDLRARGENPPKKIAPYGTLQRVPLWNTAV